MSKKILVVSMGRGGNMVATAFFEKLLAGCGVGPHGEPPADAALADALTIFCDRTSNGRIIPRRLMGAIDECDFPASSLPYGTLYPAEAKVLGMGGLDDRNHRVYPNWATGHETPTVETLFELTRKRVEDLGGDVIIWLFHSLGGTYGSGGGSKFLELAAEQLDGTAASVAAEACGEDSIQGDAERLDGSAMFAAVVSIPILPSARVTDSIPAEPYNAILALPSIFEHAHLVFVLDNGALFDASRSLASGSPTLEDINLCVGIALSTLVSPMLWPDKAGRRLTPDEFHSCLINPTSSALDSSDAWSRGAEGRTIGERLITISTWEDATSPSESNADIARRVVGPRKNLLSTETAKDWMSVLVVLNSNHADVSDLNHVIAKGVVRLAINTHAKTTRAIAAGRNTGLVRALGDLRDNYVVLRSRKSYLHRYTMKGLDESDFEEAERALRTAIGRLEDDAR